MCSKISLSLSLSLSLYNVCECEKAKRFQLKQAWCSYMHTSIGAPYTPYIILAKTKTEKKRWRSPKPKNQQKIKKSFQVSCCNSSSSQNQSRNNEQTHHPFSHCRVYFLRSRREEAAPQGISSRTTCDGRLPDRMRKVGSAWHRWLRIVSVLLCNWKSWRIGAGAQWQIGSTATKNHFNSGGSRLYSRSCRGTSARGPNSPSSPVDGNVVHFASLTTNDQNRFSSFRRFLGCSALWHVFFVVVVCVCVYVCVNYWLGQKSIITIVLSIHPSSCSLLSFK